MVGSGLGGIGTAAAAEAPPEVPPELITAVLSRLPPNEVALSVRRTCRAAAQHFAEEHHRTAAIGQPLPPHAASGTLGEEAEAAFRGLTFQHKLRTLSVAAASGSVTNLEVAWRLLHPCVFPELLTTDYYLERLRQEDLDISLDAGTAAARSANMSALSWLLDRCPGLVNRSRSLEAAARHCPLPQLQEAWGLLSSADSSLSLNDAVLGAAAESPTPDAVAKMEWLLQQGGCSLTPGTATAAARSGDLARLKWLQGRGCPFDNWGVLEAALRHADVLVAEWLVDEAGCPFPGRHVAGCLVSAAAASGSVAKLRWLQARGVLPEGPNGMLLAPVAMAGQLDALRFVHQQGRDMIVDSIAIGLAVRSGDVGSVAYLLGAGCPVGEDVVYGWYITGCKGGLAMLRWLLDKARVSASGLSVRNVIESWPRTTPADSRQLLEAVRLVAPLGRSSGGRAAKEAVAALCLAADRGDLGLLRYLHEELGGELGPSVLAGAARGGCEAMLEWLVEQGCGAGETGAMDDCYLAAGGRGNLGTLVCLRSLGVPWGEGLLLKAVQQCLPLPVMQWMWGQGARIGPRDLQEAARLAGAQRDGDRGRRVAEWLRRVGAESRSRARTASAVEGLLRALAGTVLRW